MRSKQCSNKSQEEPKFATKMFPKKKKKLPIQKPYTPSYNNNSSSRRRLFSKTSSSSTKTAAAPLAFSSIKSTESVEERCWWWRTHTTHIEETWPKEGNENFTLDSSAASKLEFVLEIAACLPACLPDWLLLTILTCALFLQISPESPY